MSKRGVSKISGNSSPKVGEATTYHITEWYPATPKTHRDAAGVTWELFKKRHNGSYTTTNIKKTGSGTFTFGEVAQRNTYRLEAYLYEPEGSGPTCIEINPQPVAIPRINKVDLQYVDDSPGTVFSYTEKMHARAQCVNLSGQKLKFSLWEDDAAGDGHNAINLLIETKEATVNSSGVAVAEFMLTRALMQKAIQGETDPQKLEFYVTVEYFSDRKHATDNVNVNNPLPVPTTRPQPRPQQSSNNNQPAQPSQSSPNNVPPRAQGSPAAEKPQSQKEEKGITDTVTDWWNNLELWDWGESSGTIETTQPPTQQPAGGRTVSIVQSPQSNSEDGCPRCKILVREEVDQIFTEASEENKTALINAFNEGNKLFNIDSCLRKAHFFAQVLAEVGTSLNLNEPESFNYSARRLKDGDYVRNGVGWVKDLVNGGHYSSGTWASSPFSYFKTHHAQANLYGRKDLNRYNDNGIQAANSREIANLVYADENRSARYKLGNVNPGDGWKFMGKGIIQITGRSNYTEVNRRLVRKGFDFDIVNNPDSVLNHRESVLSAMAFWYWKDLQLRSNGGREVVDGITRIVNEGTSTYNQRKTNFDKTYEVFQVAKCSPVENTPTTPSGNWRLPIDEPMLCLYSQGGALKPWHGSFGEKIRDVVSNHSGSDLLAVPGTPVYACLKSKVERVYTSTTLAGKTIVLKVIDKETFKTLKTNYVPIYSEKGELTDKGFNHDGDIYLVFMHLSSFGTFEVGTTVEHNDVIGYTGISGRNGNNFETRNPHLHFEVNNVGSAGGLNGKCNPMVYFKFKTETEMTAADKSKQEEIKNKVWK